MDILNVKSGNEWVGIPAIQGPQGAKGDKGDKGDDGQDGFSPAVSISLIEGGKRITVTDSTGPHTADILDGDPSNLIAVQNTEPEDPDVQLWIDDTNAPEGIQIPTYEEHLEGLAQKAPIIIDSKSGNPIVINDGVPGLKLYDMKVSFIPKQEGTGDPSPTNIRPITGWTGLNINRTGVNLCGCEWEEGQILTDGTEAGSPDRKRTVGFFPVVGGQDYSIVSDDQYKRVYWYNKEKAFISSDTGSTAVKTAPSNAFYARAVIINETTPNPEETYSFNFPSSETEYFPYSGTTIPVSWQTEAGTVYGGELDAMSGVLTIEYYYVELDAAGKQDNFFYNTAANKNIPNIEFDNAGLVCNRLKPVSNVSGVETNPTIAFYGNGIIRFVDPDYSGMTWTEYNAAVENDPVIIAYKIATPYAVQLTPIQIALLTGVNTIWTDADSMEIAYPVDTKKYIDAGSSNVKDVQLIDTSILVNGVANIPRMTSSVSGVAKVGNGLGMSSSGQLRINAAGDSYLKAGTDLYYPVVSGKQHVSAFYALAKLAGVDLANETVTLGQYPDAAKIAIQKMLGVYQSPWEIINEESFTNATEADKIITVDKYGNPFELVEAIMLFELPKLSDGDVDSSKGNYGQIWFIYDNGNKYIAPEPGSFSRVVGGDGKGAWYYIQNNNGLIVTMATLAATNTNSQSLRMRYIHNSYSGMGVFVDDGTFGITSVNIRGVTGNGQYRLYGRRKWT